MECCHCGTKLRAPWVGTGIVRCGACQQLLQIKRPDGNDECGKGACGHGHGKSKRGTGLGGFEDPTTCICEKIFFWCPSAAPFYFAIALTSFIIGMGFIRVAPLLFPAPSTPAGAMLWFLSVYISVNTVANFYWGARTDPGQPPALASDGVGLNEKTSKEESDGKDTWCDQCNAAKPPGTHHCRRCKRCVYQLVSCL